MKYLFSFILLVFFYTSSYSQADDTGYPAIGKACPEFNLKSSSTQQKLSSEGLKGKWVVLDFWTSSCSVCIASFPKLNALQKEFSGEIQFVLIGNNEQHYNKGIEKLYEGLSKRQGLKLTAVFDSVLFKRFGVTSTPHLIIIDPQGIVRAITYPSELNSRSLSLFLSGGNPNLLVKANKMEAKAKESERVDPFASLFNVPHQSGFTSSVISKWNSNNPVFIVNNIPAADSIYCTTATSLKRLYNIAFLGKTDWDFEDSLYSKQWISPILELKDSSLFHSNFLREQGLYNYAIKVPQAQANQQFIQNALRLDLERSFGYKVKLEKRTMPCWFLMSDKDKRNVLKSKGGKSTTSFNRLGFVLNNIPVDVILKLLWDKESPKHKYPIIDKTEINFNVDIRLAADMSDFNDIVLELNKKGLHLVSGNCEMNVIVIKD